MGSNTSNDLGQDGEETQDRAMGHEPVDRLLKERPCGWALRGTRLLTSGQLRDDTLRAARWRSRAKCYVRLPYHVRCAVGLE